MKRTIFLLFIILFQLKLFAEPVYLNDATTVAEFFLEVNYKDSLYIEQMIELENEEQTIVAYIATLNPQGFVAVSTDTDIRPIVAYSFLNNFIFDNDENNTLYHFLIDDMVNRLELKLLGLLENSQENNELWENYLTLNWAYFLARDFQQWPPEETSTGGWLETVWDQNSPYNDFCPLDPETLPPNPPPELRCIVGCTATALSQVLNYHKYIGNRVWSDVDDYESDYTTPHIFIDDDFETYDFPSFSQLNDYLNTLRTHYESQVPLTDEDMAALCFISGIACEMNYSSSASGAAVNDFTLVEKFEYDYAEDICSYPPFSFYLNLIIDMKNAQPALLTIQSPDRPLHEVVCDGYRFNDDLEDYYHINFGWGFSNPGGGFHPTEAWYDLPYISFIGFGGPVTYNSIVSSVMHICPPDYNGTITGRIHLNGGSGDVTDVVVTAGYKTTNPDAYGNYEIEIYNGNYEVSAYLWGYEEAFYEEVEVISGQICDNIDFVLEENPPAYIYIPTQFLTINEGIAEADDGDIVVVLPGTYDENISFDGKRIKVVSWYYFSNDENFIDSTIINGNLMAQGCYLVTFYHGEDFNSSLEGFTINGTSTSSTYKGIRCFYSSPTLKNLNIINTTCGNNHGAAIYLDFSDPVIENVKIHQIYESYSSVYLYFSNPILNNILIYDNEGKALYSNRSNSALNNVTICDNVQFGIHSIRGTLDLNNCLIWGNDFLSTPSVQINNSNSLTDITVNYSDIQGGGWQGNGNINTLPLVDDNYKPLWTETEYSPLIDTGDPSILDPDGTPSDIGAVRAINHKVDSIELIDMIEGINWLCFPVLDTVFTDADIAASVLYDIMLPPYPAALQLVETQDPENNIYFIFPDWYNDNQQFTSVKGYKIHMNEAATLEITGFLECVDTWINLYEGQENWIGYFLEESMNPLDAFEAVLDDIDEIRTKYFALVKEHGEWVPPNEWTINYGDLVIVNCTNDCSFKWGQSGVPEKTRAPSEGFSYVEESDYIPVFVELDQQALGDPTEIGIFVESECKGAAVIEDSLVQICAYVLNDSMVFDPGMVEFQLYYGSRSENVLIDSYSIKDNLDDAGNIEKLDFSQNPQRYYIISITDSGNNVPDVIKTSLEQNFPNPFNPETTINYSISDEGNVELEVYNIKGQKVKTLINEIKEPGHYQAIWDGTDNNKKQVSSGIYLYKLSTGKKTLNKKMLLLK